MAHDFPMPNLRMNIGPFPKIAKIQLDVYIYIFMSTVKILLDIWAFLRIVTIHRCGAGHLLEATSARKVIKLSHPCSFSQRVAILKKRS